MIPKIKSNYPNLNFPISIDEFRKGELVHNNPDLIYREDNLSTADYGSIWFDFIANLLDPKNYPSEELEKYKFGYKIYEWPKAKSALIKRTNIFFIRPFSLELGVFVEEEGFLEELYKKFREFNNTREDAKIYFGMTSLEGPSPNIFILDEFLAMDPRISERIEKPKFAMNDVLAFVLRGTNQYGAIHSALSYSNFFGVSLPFRVETLVEPFVDSIKRYAKLCNLKVVIVNYEYEGIIVDPESVEDPQSYIQEYIEETVPITKELDALSMSVLEDYIINTIDFSESTIMYIIEEFLTKKRAGGLGI